MKKKGKVIRRGTYGAAKTYSTSSSDSYAGSDDGGGGGGGSSVWNAEKMPLLSMKEKEARILGAKRRISRATVERAISIDVDTLIGRPVSSDIIKNACERSKVSMSN